MSSQRSSFKEVITRESSSAVEGKYHARGRHARQESGASQLTASTSCEGLERFRWADCEIGSDASDDECSRNLANQAEEDPESCRQQPQPIWKPEAKERVQVGQPPLSELDVCENGLPIYDKELPSFGSRFHHAGRCRPCAFHHKKGCKAGRTCTFCHLCPASEAAGGGIAVSGASTGQSLRRRRGAQASENIVVAAEQQHETTMRVTETADSHAATGGADEAGTLGQTHSVGSQGHYAGRCKPCAFFHTKGCNSGPACLFCHLCPPREVQRRKNIRRQMYMRLQNQMGPHCNAQAEPMMNTCQPHPSQHCMVQAAQSPWPMRGAFIYQGAPQPCIVGQFGEPVMGAAQAELPEHYLGVNQMDLSGNIEYTHGALLMNQ